MNKRTKDADFQLMDKRQKEKRKQVVFFSFSDQSVDQCLLIRIKNIQKQYYAPTESRARKAGAVQVHRKKNTTLAKEKNVVSKASFLFNVFSFFFTRLFHFHLFSNYSSLFFFIYIQCDHRTYIVCRVSKDRISITAKFQKRKQKTSQLFYFPSVKKSRLICIDCTYQSVFVLWLSDWK